MFSKPVSREVEAKDVKYALERAFTANVANGYARVYLGDIKGVPKKPGDYQEIPGIETPDKYTLVLNLTKGTGAAAAGALGMPISVPVPKEFAQKYDAETPSTYGEEAAVYTGPYMVKSDADGKAIGYVAGKTHRPGPQPGLRPGGRLPPGVPRRDRVPGRQRRHRGRDAPHPERREPRRRRHRAARRGSSRGSWRPTSRSSRRCRAVAGA